MSLHIQAPAPTAFSDLRTVLLMKRDCCLALLQLGFVERQCAETTGASGANKTTLVNLLTGLLGSQWGQLLVNGSVVAPDIAHRIRGRIAYVAQDSYLFNDTIRRDSASGGPHVSDAAIWHALALTGTANLVRGMPDGLHQGRIVDHD